MSSVSDCNKLSLSLCVFSSRGRAKGKNQTQLASEEKKVKVPNAFSHFKRNRRSDTL